MVLKLKLKDSSKSMINSYKKRNFSDDIVIREGFIIGRVIDSLHVTDHLLQTYIKKMTREGGSTSSTVTLRAEVFQTLEDLQRRTAAFTNTGKPLAMSLVIDIALQIEAAAAQKAKEQSIHFMVFNTGLTEPAFRQRQNFDETVSFVKKFIDETNGIAILQQIPYKQKENNRWCYDALFLAFCDVFSPENGYTVFFNEDASQGYIVMLTAAITKRKDVLKGDSELYSKDIPMNRQVAIAIKQPKTEDPIELLGVHISAGAQNAAQLQAINDKSEIILGDFNAGNYAQCENRDVFAAILPKHVSICNLPTRRSALGRLSSIDHVFVNTSNAILYSNLVIHNDVTLSDHYPITFQREI